MKKLIILFLMLLLPIKCFATNQGATNFLGNVGINITGTQSHQLVVNGTIQATTYIGSGSNITGVPNNNVLAVTLATGTSVSLTAPREYYVCTGTCTVTPPVPVAGDEFCAMNGDNISTVITMAAIGSSAQYENTARTAYGTAGTGTFISGGAVGDKVCIVGLDATHYLTVAYNGTWTAS